MSVDGPQLEDQSVPLDEHELWTTAKSLEIQRATESLISLDADLEAAKAALEKNPADQEARRKCADLANEIASFNDQVGHSDVGSTSLALSVIEQQIAHADNQAQQMENHPEGVTQTVKKRLQDLNLQANTPTKVKPAR